MFKKPHHIGVISLSRQLALRTEEVQQHVFLFAHVAFGVNPINLYKWQEWLWITMMINASDSVVYHL